MAVQYRGVARGLRALAARLELICSGPSPDTLAFRVFPLPQASFDTVSVVCTAPVSQRPP